MQEEAAPAGRQGAERDLGGSAAGAQEPNDAPDSWAWDPWGTTSPPPSTAEQASSSEVVEDASITDPWGGEAADEPSATADWGDWMETFRENVRESVEWRPDEPAAPTDQAEVADASIADPWSATTPEAGGFLGLDGTEPYYITTEPLPEDGLTQEAEPLPDPQAESDIISCDWDTSPEGLPEGFDW